MAKNSSNSEKTVLSMKNLLKNDVWSVGRVQYYSNYEDIITVSTNNLLANFRDYFDQLLVEVDVPEDFYYQPAAFAENYYGTPDLDFIVLYFANMMSAFEFTKSKIKVIPRSKLTDLSRLMTQYKSEIEESQANPERFIEYDSLAVKKK